MQLRASSSTLPRAWPFLATVAAVALATAIGLLVFDRSQISEIVMVYLLAIVLVSMRFGYAPAVTAAVLSALTLDFFFVKPYLTFIIGEPERIITIPLLFVVGFAMSGLTKRVRGQAVAARDRETRTARLYALSRELTRTLGIEDMLKVAVRHLHDTFNADVVVLLPGAAGALKAAVKGEGTFSAQPSEQRVAEWVWHQQRTGGLGTDVFSNTECLFLPLHGARGKVGVLGIRPVEHGAVVDADQRQLLNTFAALLGSALEREHLAEAAQRAQLEIEKERLRSALLSSVSHDLRTPLGVITGATSTLLQDQDAHFLAAAARKDLIESAHEEADRLNRLVRNLLDMTRLVSGAIQPHKELHPLDEVVGVALNRLEARLEGRNVTVALPADLPPLAIDDVLIEQVLINILENAIKYTPAGTPIEILATTLENSVEIAVADRGPGVPVAEQERIFEKFHRLNPQIADGGVGLGLAIYRAIIEAHGGRIWVENRKGRGATFRFWLPLDSSVAVTETSWPQAS